jgi:hypothetical protein
MWNTTVQYRTLQYGTVLYDVNAKMGVERECVSVCLLHTGQVPCLLVTVRKRTTNTVKNWHGTVASGTVLCSIVLGTVGEEEAPTQRHVSCSVRRLRSVGSP